MQEFDFIPDFKQRFKHRLIWLMIIWAGVDEQVALQPHTWFSADWT